MAKKKQEIANVEQVAISPRVEWSTAQSGIHGLQQLLGREISYLEANDGLQNAYSPMTWLRMCESIRAAVEGMAAVRLSVDGKSAAEVSAETGISTSRIAAYKAWNTQYRKCVVHYLRRKWRKQEERKSDIAFLRSIGIAVEDEAVIGE